LKETFKFLFKSDLNNSQAVEKIKSELEQTDEIKNLLDFIEKSERGLIK
jgi:acyl-[acyl carrier protein]--UDP-N-acetylglucosamine O-acyltransferase